MVRPRIQKPKKTTPIGRRLLKTRIAKGLTQQELADKSGDAQATIQKIESGHSLRPRNIDRIASALKVSPVYLLYGISNEAMRMAKAYDKAKAPVQKRVERILSKGT